MAMVSVLCRSLETRFIQVAHCRRRRRHGNCHRLKQFMVNGDRQLISGLISRQLDGDRVAFNYSFGQSRTSNGVAHGSVREFDAAQDKALRKLKTFELRQVQGKKLRGASSFYLLPATALSARPTRSRISLMALGARKKEAGRAEPVRKKWERRVQSNDRLKAMILEERTRSSSSNRSACSADTTFLR